MSARRGRAVAVALGGAALAAAFAGAAPAFTGAAPASAGASAAGAVPAVNRNPVARVLVLSLPYVRWEDLRLSELPHLRALLDESALAGLGLRGVNDSPTLADGYLTISTGARAEARPTPACAPAPSLAASCPGAAGIAAHNDGLLFDARVGLLGDTLARARVRTALVARDAPARPGGTAALALADGSGVVHAGDTTGALSRLDSRAPLGERADAGAYRAVFERVWRDRAVVLVEASDLVRVEATRSTGRQAQVEDDRSAALRAFDGVVGELLSHVDPARDAVLVVAPSQPAGPLTLTVASLRAPELRPGLLRSAFTRRSGIVALVDVAPTILDLLGVPRPDQMEGRAFEYGRGGGDLLEERIDWIVATNRRSRFRDAAITQANGVFVGSQLAFAGIATMMLAVTRRRGRVTLVLELVALTLCFFLPATYLAVPLPFAHWGLPAYWTFVFGTSIAAALVTYVSTDRRGVAALLIALGSIVGLIVVDVCTGARLQFNGAFGYSPTIGGRYAGLGNLGFAQLAAGAALLGGLAAHRIGGRRGAWAAAGVFTVAVVADGAPFFGADVGGVLSMVPAYGIATALLLGWRFRWSLVAWWGVAAVALLGVFAAIDLARPPESRTHLGRLLGAGGSDISIVLQRKLDANLSWLAANPFVPLLPLTFVAVAYFVYRAPGALGVVREHVPQMTAALAGLGIVAFLGTALNDSGIAITGVMFGVLVPVLVVLAVRVGLPLAPSGAPAEGRAP
jgi:hypothetical protein